MRILTLMIFVLLLPSGRCLSQAEVDLPAKEPHEPDHLVPLDPHSIFGGMKYAKLVRRKLKLPKEQEEAVMIYSPTFEGEECIVLHRSAGEPATFILIYTRADQNLWYSMPDNSDDGKRKRVKVTHLEAPIPQEIAERVCHVWDKMLRGVHYPLPGEEPGGSDGDTIEFRRHRMYGQAWTPSGGAPKGLVDLGRALINFCVSSEDERAEALRQIEMRCQALEKYLDKKAAA